MGLNLTHGYGQTPLDEEEKEGLLVASVSTRGELDEFEQQNIEEAMQWLLTRSPKSGAILTESFVCRLHLRMYGSVWAWAGHFRRTDKNLGIDKWQIPTALKILLDDTAFWIAKQTYAPDEIALRFKHRIVSIHCFPNGNGRHSRLMADILVEKVYKLPVFSWGARSGKPDAVRAAYLHALRAADSGDMRPLLVFARS